MNEELREAIEQVKEVGAWLRGVGVGPTASEWQLYRPEGAPTTRRLWAMTTGVSLGKRGHVTAAKWRRLLNEWGLGLPARKTAPKRGPNYTGEEVEFVTEADGNELYPILPTLPTRRERIYFPHLHGWADVLIAAVR